MIAKKFFINAFIDLNNNEIVIGSKKLSETEEREREIEYEVFTCSGCGATGKKPQGKLGECEYCGAPSR